jgi:hypothetical protein
MIINPYIYGVATSYDPDAQLFFNAQTAAGVTLTTTEMNAVNQWVLDSKAANIWTKMKAVYPMVGGSPTSQKFNLKNPLDTNAAFRLNFIGGGTHSSNGYQPNGINAYANTFLNPSVAYSIGTSGHMSYYSRTDSNGASEREMGALTGVIYTDLGLRYSGNLYMRWGETGGPTQVASPNSLGFYVASRTAINVQKIFKNGTQVLTSALTGNLLPNLNFYLGCQNSSNSPTNYTAKQCAFASIGDGLTDLESQLFYQITEKYQVALSRNINALQSFYYNSAYNNETNAFLFSTQITDTTTQLATNTLVTDLKTANIFTKMKAIYPMVGGAPATCKFNLVNAQDSNAAYRLTFVGGGTFSSNGYLPNGVNAYADTFLIPSTAFANTNNHLSYYSRTSANVGNVDMGAFWTNSATITAVNFLVAGRPTDGNAIGYLSNDDTNRIAYSQTNASGMFVVSRAANNSLKMYQNNILKQTNTVVATSVFNTLPQNSILIGAANYRDNISSNPFAFGNHQCAFASIGNGLTDAEALALYNAVQTFNTSLSRNV